MGNAKWLNNKESPEYETVDIIDGVEVLRRINGNIGTPMNSNNSLIYLTYNDKTMKVKQITCYDPTTHVKIYDIDTDHGHGDIQGAHVQYYYNGVRCENADFLNKEQQDLYNKFYGREVKTHGH